MKSITIVAVHFDVARDIFEVVKEIVHDDNTTELNLHTFFASTIEWKAAEYGIDNIDELIDLILFEPFVEPIDVLGMTAEEAKAVHLPKVLARRGELVQSSRGKLTATRSTLQAAGVDAKYIAALTEDPHAAIRAHAPFDAEVIAVRKAYLIKVREDTAKVKGESTVKVRPSGAVRATQERARLFRQENMRRENGRAGDRRGG